MDALRYQISRHKLTTTLIVIVVLYTLSWLWSDDEKYVFDLSDGAGTRGFGITRGGTGMLGYQKNNRVGGLPPQARKVYEDGEPLEYSGFEVDDVAETGIFDKDSNKLVIILGANLEGGVNKWKGPNEWSIERSSILNKKKYARLHGYDLVIKDYTKSKKYSNEHREGWQKFDIIKEVMDEYNTGDWFWYLDLYTLIMEPQVTLEELVFANLNDTVSRDLLDFNPAHLELDIPFTDYDEPLNMILAQDCGGFNLHSFLVKKTRWTYALFDTLFDPVVYMKQCGQWKNGEKNALEYYYNTYGWVRSRIGFVPTKLISALPRGACPDAKYDTHLFYNETTRDFVVDMVGCEFNRNCWDEMEFFKKLSEHLHKTWLKRLISW